MTYRVFIGSSRESIVIAEEIQSNLETSRIPELEPICWPTIFQLGSYTLESLLNTLKNSTFGIFVLSPDDYIEIRNESFRIPRDNVILEMGMFIAGVGRENTFFVYPQNTNEFSFRLPTDLDGVTGAAYASHIYDNTAQQVYSACVKIKRAIREQIEKKKAVAEGVGNKKMPPNVHENGKKLSHRIKEYQKHI